MLRENVILDRITRHYLDSRDFNGISTRQLAHEFSATPMEVARALERMVRTGTVFVLTSDSGNPSIILSDPPSIERQVEAMLSERTEEWWTVVAYPSAAHLQGIVDRSKYADRPYTLRLALGEPQLHFQAFHLRVLEFYRNDPRYMIHVTDMEGSIAFREEHEGNEVHPADNTYLQTFGFCFDKKPRRAVAVFLRYLSGLSPEHQHLWKASALEGDFELHRDYRNKAAGLWASRDMSCFEAMLEFLRTINAMCAAAGWEPLFKRDFAGSDRPSEFTFLIRPTAKAFDGFVQVLDKMLGDNLNPEGFPGIERHTVNKDGTRTPRGTITLLQEWIRASTQLQDDTPLVTLVKTFRNVRTLRSKPSHDVIADNWDDAFMDQQRQLMEEVLDALAWLRAIIALHPKAKTVPLSEVFMNAHIYFT